MVDTKLIKMLTNHYWIKRDNVVDKIDYKGRVFYNKFEKVNQMMSRQIMNEHAERKVTIAHSLINPSRNIVENIVIDYNGRNTDRFWHRAQLLLREEGFINFTAYESQTAGHLHLYIHKGHTAINEAYQLSKMLDMKLAQRMPREWKMFPNQDLPPEYNILTLPYGVYQKERGASWSKHL
jgi:hypothetical protein